MSIPTIKTGDGQITQSGSDIVNLLYKKFNNVAYTDNTLYLGYEATSRPNVYINQIISEILPPCPNNRYNEYVLNRTETNLNGSFYTVKGPPPDISANIVFIEGLILNTFNFQTYFLPDIFKDIIFDPGNNYNLLLFVNGNSWGDGLNWSIDADAGVLAFYDNQTQFGREFTNDDIIQVNFWKYTGVKGINGLNGDGIKGYTGATGYTGPAGPMNPDFTNPPNPATDLSLTPTPTSQQINLTWTYPRTTKYSFHLLPAVDTFFYQINPPHGTISGNTSNFVDPSDTTLVISSLGSVGGFTVNSITHTATLTGVKDISVIRIWYGNFSGFSTFADINAAYASANPPGIPINIAFNTPLNPPPTTAEQAQYYQHGKYASTLTWNIPPAETPESTSDSIEIESYDISYNSSGSLIRSTTLTHLTDVSSGTSLTNSFSNFESGSFPSALMPDASYSFQVQSINNVGKKSGFSDTLVAYVPPLLPNIPVVFPSSQAINNARADQVFISDTIKTHTNIPGSIVQSVIDDISNANLLISLPNTISTKGIKWPVQKFTNRGILYDSTNKTQLSISTTNGGTSTTLFNLPLDGSFNGAIMSTGKKNGVLLNGNYEDAYPLSFYPISYQGFYADLSINSIAIDTNAFMASPSLQSFDISDNQGNTKNVLTYFYDGTYNNSAPIFQGISILNLSKTTFITGFPVLTDLNLKINIIVKNIGTYFYTNPILSYNIKGTNVFVNEINLTNLSLTSLNSDGSLKNIATFLNTNAQVLLATTTNKATNIYRYPFTPNEYGSPSNINLSTPLVLNAIAQNAINTSSQPVDTNIIGIIDQPSINIVQNVIAQTMATSKINSVQLTNLYTGMNTTPLAYIGWTQLAIPSVPATLARRILSNVYLLDLSGTTNNTNLNTLVTTTDYSYDNSQNLGSGIYANELPIINGFFCHPTQIYGPPGNTVDFAADADGSFRYVTFMWQIQYTEGQTNPDMMIFEFEDANQEFSFDGMPDYALTTLPGGSTNVIKVDFAILCKSVTLQQVQSSSWVNGAILNETGRSTLTYVSNRQTGTNLICLPDIYLSAKKRLGYRVPTITPTTNQGTANPIYILLRVGIKKGSTYKFSNVKAVLSFP
jgi:hypothetical protein